MSDSDAMTGPMRAGERLRQAREQAGIDLAEVAARTRIPQRHLEAIEADDFAALPSTTYSVGFARAYARIVGADEVAIAASVRQQLDGAFRERHNFEAFQPADPARVPPKGLAWTVAIVAMLLIAGYALWRNQWLAAPGVATPPQVAQRAVGPAVQPDPVAPPRTAAAPATGPVVLTATDTVWLRINDAAGKRLFEKEMQAGETYSVPAEATGATLNTGRPNALKVTLGGVEVPPLGAPEQRIKNVAITPEALRAHAAGQPGPVQLPTPTPGVTAPVAPQPLAGGR